MERPAVERVVLELFDGEPISGRICGSVGAARPFRGWLEFTSLIERVRATSNAGEAVSGQGTKPD
jgi:hypothetical protein